MEAQFSVARDSHYHAGFEKKRAKTFHSSVANSVEDEDGMESAAVKSMRLLLKRENPSTQSPYAGMSHGSGYGREKSGSTFGNRY